MMLNSFLKWIRLLSLSTLFINDLHIWIAWSPWAFQIMLIEKWILLKSPEFKRQQKNWFKKYYFSYIAYLYIFIFLLKIWRNVRHGFARGYRAVQNVLAIQCQRPKPSFGRGTFTWRSSLAIGRYCQRRWGCLPQSECIYLLGCAALRAASIHVCTIQFVVFLRLPP